LSADSRDGTAIGVMELFDSQGRMPQHGGLWPGRQGEEPARVGRRQPGDRPEIVAGAVVEMGAVQSSLLIYMALMASSVRPLMRRAALGGGDRVVARLGGARIGAGVVLAGTTSSVSGTTEGRGVVREGRRAPNDRTAKWDSSGIVHGMRSTNRFCRTIVSPKKSDEMQDSARACPWKSWPETVASKSSRPAARPPG